MKSFFFAITLLLLTPISTYAQYEIKLGTQYSGTGSIYKNITFYNEINRTIGDFVKVGVGYSVFSDMSNDVFFESINYSHQLAVKSPYAVISFLPINFDNHELSLGIGYSLGKIEENTPSYYAYDSSQKPTVIKKILFRKSNYWDPGYLARLSYSYKITKSIAIGVDLQYTEYNNENSPEFTSMGVSVAYKF